MRRFGVGEVQVMRCCVWDEGFWRRMWPLPTPTHCFYQVVTVVIILLSLCSHMKAIPEAYEQLPLSPFKDYGSMSMFHYSVPQQVSQVSWRFVATVDHVDCPRLTAHIALQQGAFPVVNPDDSRFPDQIIVDDKRLFELETTAEYRPNSTTLVHVLNPLPGDWFAAAYLLPQPKKEISVKGLQRDCIYALATLATWSPQRRARPILPEQPYSGVLSEEEKYTLYKIYVPESVWMLSVHISCSPHPSPSCPLSFSVRARALPFFDSPDTVNCSVVAGTGCTSVIRQPYTQAFHYILLYKHEDSSRIHFNLTVHMIVCDGREGEDVPRSQQEVEHVNWSSLSFEELSSSSSLLSLNESSDGSTPPLALDTEHHNYDNTSEVAAALSTGRNSGMGEVEVIKNVSSKNIQPVGTYDNILIPQQPGSECLAVIPMMRIKHLEDFSDTFVVEGKHWYTTQVEVTDVAPSLYTFHLLPYMDIGGTLQFAASIIQTMNVTYQDVRVKICIEEGHSPTYNGSSISCSVNRSLTLSSSMSSTNDQQQSLTDQLYFPFPTSGSWFFTTHAACANRLGEVEKCSGSIFVTLDVKTTPCMPDEDGNMCGTHGVCREARQGQFLYCYCSCLGGWRGWACNDGSQAPSPAIQLLGTLLLTLSNLMFLPAIALATYRRYFPEAVVYAGNMFFSTFYHACDRDEFAWCLMRYDILQFMDFYLSILSFWMTLLAMSGCNRTLLSVLHVAGCIAVALGVTYERFGLISFLVPSAIAALVLIISWVQKCSKSHQFYPGRKRCLYYILPGLLLAGVGLTVYAFVETNDNYKYTHSMWHIIVSSSILFLLPPRRTSTCDPSATSSSAHLSSTFSSPSSSSTLSSQLEYKQPHRCMEDQIALYPDPYDDESVSNHQPSRQH